MRTRHQAGAAQAGALRAPAGTCLSWDTWNHLGYLRARHRALDVQGDTAYMSKVLWMLLPQQIKHAMCTQTTAALRGPAHSPSLRVQSPQDRTESAAKTHRQGESSLPFPVLGERLLLLAPMAELSCCYKHDQSQEGVFRKKHRSQASHILNHERRGDD